MQKIDGIPDDMKRLYKTVWEISQKTIIQMAADRGPYIDQSQSLNIHFAEPDKKKLDSAHFYAWKKVLNDSCSSVHSLGKMWKPGVSCGALGISRISPPIPRAPATIGITFKILLSYLFILPMLVMIPRARSLNQ